MSQPHPDRPGQPTPGSQSPAAFTGLHPRSVETPDRPGPPGMHQSSPAVPIAPTPQPDLEPRSPEWRAFDLPVSTTGDLPGRRIGRVLGIVFGVATRPRDLAHHPDMAYFAVVARQDALASLVQQASTAGADAVIGVSFNTGKLTEGVAEITACGTAVTLAD